MTTGLPHPRHPAHEQLDVGDGLRGRVEQLEVENDLLRDKVEQLRAYIRQHLATPNDQQPNTTGSAGTLNA